MEICIYETDEDYKARMVVNILKKNRIMSFCKNLGIQNLYGYSKLFTGSDLIVGGIKVYVKQSDAGKAKQIINRINYLKNTNRTIENDKIKKDTYISQRALMFSIASFFIIPFFFNIEYIIYCFKNKLRVKYLILILNISYFLFSIVFCFYNHEFLRNIWKWNFFLTLAFSIGKGIDLNKKQSKYKYLMILPTMLLIISYGIADQVFNIRIF